MARAPLLQVIPIAPELQREAHAGQQVSIPGSNGLAEAASNIAREFGGVAAKIGALADHAAQVEGRDAGHLAGMDPEFRRRNDGTLRGEAFDRAATTTALARTRVEIQNDIEATAQKHQADPSGLAKELKGKLSGYLEGADPALHPEISTLFQHGSFVAQRAATRQLWSRQAAEQAGAMQDELGRTLRSVHQSAYAAGLDPASDAMLADQVARLEQTLGRTGPDGKRLVAPETAAKMLQNAKEEVSQSRLYGAFERLPDLAAKEAFVKKLDADFAASTGVAAAFDFRTFEQTKAHLEAEVRRDQARGRQGNATLNHLVGEVQKRADKGYGVQPEELAALKSQVAVKATPEVQAALADAEDSLRFQQAARRLSLPELEQTVSAMRAQLAANPSSIADRGRINRRLEKADALLKEAQATVKSNPLDWERRVGMADVVPLGAVDPRQPGAYAQWGAQRVAQAEDAAKRHGLGKPVYLQPVEVRQLAKQFEQGGEAGLAAIATVSQAFGTKAEDVLVEVGRKEAPVGALIGRLAVRYGMSPAVNDAAEGLHLRTNPAYKRLAPADSVSKFEAKSVVGDALANAPGYLAQAMRTADAIYETRANREGERASFAPRIWKQALREALGEVDHGGVKFGGPVNIGGWFSGNQVVLPPSIAQDKAAATFHELRPDDFRGFDADGKPLGGVPKFASGRELTRQELRGASYVTAAPGKYLLRVNGGWAVDDNGRPFVVDIDAALPAIRRRRPDLR